MRITYQEYYSQHLQRHMPFKIYGHGGKPLLVFPSSGGSFYEYEDFGMVEAVKPFIERGEITLFTASSIDGDSWLSTWIHPHDKAKNHQAYDRFILEEMVPFIQNHSHWQGPLMTTGCSMGAFHALNFYLKHPDVFDGAIALSGIYDARFFTGGYMDEAIYYNSPVDYLRDLSDPWFLDRLRQGHLVISSGQGRWEEDTLRDTRLVDTIMAEKGIPAWFDYWGYDVDHDWPWWRVQMPHFLQTLKEQELL